MSVSRNVSDAQRDRLAVAGIRFVHDGTRGIHLPESLTPAWPGSRISDTPLIVHHAIGDTSAAGLQPVIEAPIALGDYFLDDRSQIAVRSRAQQTPGFRPQLLMTVRGGYEYEIRYSDPRDSPLLQWGWPRTILMLSLPLRKRGLLVHATGFTLPDGTAVLCPAVSGGGKSTLARLLKRYAPPNTTLLSDDRIALTCDGPSLRIWGTPWHSSAGVAGAGDGVLRALVFVTRGPGASVAPLSRSDALRRVLRTVGLPFWDPAATDFALGVIDQLIRTVPCFEFAYTPSQSAAESFLEELHTIFAGDK